MRVFLTGATGYIGSAVAERLIRAGHQVAGLARSDEAVRKLEAAGVTPVRGNLRATAALAESAATAEAVIHIGLEWSTHTAEIDRAAVESLLNALEGSGKPFIYTSGVWVLGDTGDEVAGEDAKLDPPPIVAWRPAVERLVLEASDRGIRGIVIRPAMVYGCGGGALRGFVESAREKGLVQFVGHGDNHWSFVHIDALAELYLLALEKGRAGDLYVATTGPPLRVRDVAEAAARPCGAAAASWPLEEARKVLGPMADALILNQRVAGTRAAQRLGWKPEAPSVFEELARGSYA